MIKVFQESIPFSNKRLDYEISQDSAYTNPIIMPFCLDSTGGDNTLEVVFYIRNDSQSHFYTNVLITLMKEAQVQTTPTLNDAFINFDTGPALLSVNGYNNIPVDIAYEGTLYNTGLTFASKYYSNYFPISAQTYSLDNNVSVKFSYGYEEISELEWTNKNSALLIPSIGNSTMPDMSYIPIKMRIKWLTTPSILTIRDYFLDISYQSESLVGQ